MTQKRDNYLLALRCDSIGSIEVNMSTEELFQNTTLRLILKIQNDLFISVFTHYAVTHKSVFFSLAPEDKMSYIEKVVKGDNAFRSLLNGIVIALFTTQEYNDYMINSSVINRRIISMLIERLQSQIILIDSKKADQ